MEKNYSCSVIIVAYNSCDFIPACLKSVRDACVGVDAQVIVLDNGSKEPILPEIKSFFPEVVWLNSEENLGFGKGCNFAEKYATKPYLFFINPDTLVSKDSFTKVLDFAFEHPESGTVGCRILNEDGTIQWACRRSFPTAFSAISKTVGLASLFPKSKLLASYNMTYADPDQVTEVDAISGSFFCIRKDLYESLNGFDEDFFMYAEDLDLCFRTKAAGFKNYYTPSTNILHFKGQSSCTRRFKSYLNFYQAMLIFVKKHKDLYLVPHFLMALGIFFAAFVGMFSRLIPRFWKIFLDVGAVALSGLFTLSYVRMQDLWTWKTEFFDWNIVGIFAILNVIVLAVRGEYSSGSLGSFKFLKTILGINLLCGASVFIYETSSRILPHYGAIILGVLSVLFMIAWRRVAFWVNYFYRIFAKKRHRSILLGGTEDALDSWFDRYNVIPGIEILGCVSNDPLKVSEENKEHLLGQLQAMESICNRTGCRELLVVSNLSGYREPFDINWLDNLGLRVFLLIGKGNVGDYALVNLKYLH